jgi:zinc protease
MNPTHRVAALLLAGLLAAAGGARTAAAQTRIAVLPEPGTPVVATEVLVAAGTADEDDAKAGLAYLAARAIVEPVRASLDSLGARLDVRDEKEALAFSLVAAPDAWPEASRILLVALLRDPVDSLAVVRERRAIRQELAGRAANPGDALTREIDLALYGPDHPWHRPDAGYSATISQISLFDVDAFLRANLTPARTLVTVVGPVGETAVREHLRAFFGSAPLDIPIVEGASPARRPVRKEYNSITTWVAVNYRFPPAPDLEALRLLADLVAQALSFGPSQRSVYNVRSEVLPRVGESEIRFQLVVPPQEADRWAERVEQIVASLAAEPMQAPLFAERLRHYRGRRLVELNSPEARAREAARTQLLTGTPSPLIDTEDLTPARLRAAARSLDAPVVVFLGPEIRAGNE